MPLCKFIPFTKNLHFLPKKLLTSCYRATFIYPLPEISCNDNKAYRSRRKKVVKHYCIDIKEISDFLGVNVGTAVWSGFRFQRAQASHYKQCLQYDRWVGSQRHFTIAFHDSVNQPNTWAYQDKCKEIFPLQNAFIKKQCWQQRTRNRDKEIKWCDHTDPIIFQQLAP